MRKEMIPRIFRQAKRFACFPAMRLLPFAMRHDSCRVENRSCSYCTEPPYDSLEYQVQPFGKIFIRTQSKANVQVLPLDPQKFPLQNQIFVKLSGPEPTQNHFEVEKNGDELQITGIKNGDKNQNYSCTAVVPLKYDVDISVSGDKSVSVESLENDTIDVAVQHGKCDLKNIRCGKLRVQTSGGAVKCHSLLQANAQITTRGTGSISADRVQGLTFEAQSESGDIALSSVYADQTTLISRGGNLSVKNAHRYLDVHIEESGNLSIGSLDGSLTAVLAEGDVEAYMARHDQVDITTERGDIAIKVPETVCTKADLDGGFVELDSSLYVEGHVAGTRPIQGLLCGVAEVAGNKGSHPSRGMLKLATRNGQITLHTLDWFTSLNIGKLDNLDD